MFARGVDIVLSSRCTRDRSSLPRSKGNLEVFILLDFQLTSTTPPLFWICEYLQPGVVSQCYGWSSIKSSLTPEKKSSIYPLLLYFDTLNLRPFQCSFQVRVPHGALWINASKWFQGSVKVNICLQLLYISLQCAERHLKLHALCQLRIPPLPIYSRREEHARKERRRFAIVSVVLNPTRRSSARQNAQVDPFKKPVEAPQSKTPPLLPPWRILGRRSRKFCQKQRTWLLSKPRRIHLWHNSKLRNQKTWRERLRISSQKRKTIKNLRELWHRSDYLPYQYKPPTLSQDLV